MIWSVECGYIRGESKPERPGTPFRQWRSVVDLTTHAISGLCLDDVIMLNLRWYDIFRVPTQFWIWISRLIPRSNTGTI